MVCHCWAAFPNLFGRRNEFPYHLLVMLEPRTMNILLIAGCMLVFNIWLGL